MHSATYKSYIIHRLSPGLLTELLRLPLPLASSGPCSCCFNISLAEKSHASRRNVSSRLRGGSCSMQRTCSDCDKSVDAVAHIARQTTLARKALCDSAAGCTVMPVSGTFAGPVSVQAEPHHRPLRCTALASQRGQPRVRSCTSKNGESSAGSSSLLSNLTAHCTAEQSHV